MPERGFRLQLRRFMVSQRLYTLSEVVYSTRTLETVRIHKSRETASRPVTSVEKKGRVRGLLYHWNREDLAE